MKKRYAEEQIIGFLREADAGQGAVQKARLQRAELLHLEGQVVRQLQERGLSERQALRLAGMSASNLRYQPRVDGNEALRERLKELAGQHHRHGHRMLHSRLRIDGWTINVKRT